MDSYSICTFKNKVLKPQKLERCACNVKCSKSFILPFVKNVLKLVYHIYYIFSILWAIYTFSKFGPNSLYDWLGDIIHARQTYSVNQLCFLSSLYDVVGFICLNFIWRAWLNQPFSFDKSLNTTLVHLSSTQSLLLTLSLWVMCIRTVVLIWHIIVSTGVRDLFW